MTDTITSDEILQLRQELEEYQFAYQREKKARKESEGILQEQVRELYYLNKDLYAANQALVSHQKRTIANEKMAALGTLSAGMAHEINNPLAFVASNFKTLKRYFRAYSEIFARITAQTQPVDSGPELLQKVIDGSVKGLRKGHLQMTLLDTDMMFDDIDEGLLRMKDIISNLRNFSRSKSDEKVLANPADAIISAMKIMDSKIMDRGYVNCKIGEVPEMLCNLGELTQVFINLFSNSLDAINKNGEIEISTDCDAEAITIKFSDNGCGIPADKIDDIFMPFYTDKPMGLGTGLGLSISHGIIEDHGGTISVDSTVNKGTKFTILFPTKPLLGLHPEFSEKLPKGLPKL